MTLYLAWINQQITFFPSWFAQVNAWVGAPSGLWDLLKNSWDLTTLILLDFLIISSKISFFIFFS